MLIKSLLSIFILLSIVTVVFAIGDYQCVNECIRKGGSYNECTNRCNNVYQPPIIQPEQVDWDCVYRCEKRGNIARFCKKLCSY